MRHDEVFFVFKSCKQFEAKAFVDFASCDIVSMHLEGQQIRVFARRLLLPDLSRQIFRLSGGGHFCQPVLASEAKPTTESSASELR